jgi:hypothetical protein
MVAIYSDGGLPSDQTQFGIKHSLSLMFQAHRFPPPGKSWIPVSLRF